MKTIQFKLTFLIILAFGFTMTSCVEDDDFDIPDEVINIPEPEVDGDLTTIGAIAGIIEQNDGENFTIEDNIYLEGYVVSNDEGGNFFEELIIQDKPENPTAGIRISVNVNPLFGKYNFGRKIFVKLQGLTVGITNGVYAIGTVDGDRVGQIQESQAEDVLLRTSEVADIVPLPVNISDFSNELENLYIQLNDVQFPRSSVLVDDPLTFAAEPFDEFDGERVLESCESGNTTIVSTSTFADFRFLTLPSQAGSMSGVLSRDFFDDFYIFALNSTEDINFDQERCDPADFIINPSNINCDGSVSFGNLIVFTEDFESYDDGSDLVDGGWSLINVGGGSYKWGISSFSGNKYAIANAFGTEESNMNTWLVSPTINLDNTTNNVLNFEVQTNFYAGEVMSVYVSTDFVDTETDSNWSLLEEVEIPTGPDNGFGTFTDAGPISLDCLSGNVRLGFRYTGSDPGATTRYHLDNIEITGN